jgi:hypothetical protein
MRGDGVRDERDEVEDVGMAERPRGAPAGARQNVRRETAQGAVARPGGAAQNSGGSLESMDEESGHGPARGAD